MADNHSKHENHGGGHHLVPIPYYVFTLLILLVLTVVTRVRAGVGEATLVASEVP